MPYAPAHKARTRSKIINAARKRFKQQGYDGVGIDTVMADAGLTRGGFYAHFKSKADLFAAVVADPDPDTPQPDLSGDIDPSSVDMLTMMAETYLSEDHRDERSGACPMTGLATDVRRASDDAKAAYGAIVDHFVSMVSPVLPSDDPTPAEMRALGMAAAFVGGLTLSRAVKDPEQSARILAAARQASYRAAGRPAALPAD